MCRKKSISARHKNTSFFYGLRLNQSNFINLNYFDLSIIIYNLSKSFVEEGLKLNQSNFINLNYFDLSIIIYNLSKSFVEFLEMKICFFYVKIC